MRDWIWIIQALERRSGGLHEAHLDDVADGADHAVLVLLRGRLHLSLHHVDGRCDAVGGGGADAASHEVAPIEVGAAAP